MTPEEQEAFQKRQKAKNKVVAFALSGFIVLVFMVTVFKLL